MNKCKLPENWIAVNSTSYPDRVYYFNVKTNKSTWIQPASNGTEKISSEYNGKRHTRTKEKEQRRARTPEYNPEEDETGHQQLSSHAKEVSQTKKMEGRETPQMKALREKMLQRRSQQSATKSKSSNVSQECKPSFIPQSPITKLTENNNTTHAKPSSSIVTENIRKSSSGLRKSYSMSTANRKSVISLHSNDNKESTPTPQMRVLYEKIQRRSLNLSSPEKRTKIDQTKSLTDIKSRQDLRYSNRKSMNVQEKREGSIKVKSNVDCNISNVKQGQNDQTQNVSILHTEDISDSNVLSKIETRVLKKNVAKDRMKKLRKSLILTKETLDEVGCSAKNLGTDKTSCKLNRSLPASRDNGSLALANIYKNAEVRLKRLHNKVLKTKLHEKSHILNVDKPLLRQNKKKVIDNMTKDKLIEQASKEILCEEMDWEPMKDEDITLEVEVIRTQLDSNNSVGITKCTPRDTTGLMLSLESQSKGLLYIVVDTNVFLSNLEIIEEARDTTFKNYSSPFIVIPWTVIRELDYLKDDKSKSEALRMKARKAISFLNEHFSSKHPRIIGQTREQAIKNKGDFSLECPDDEILQCCLQIRELKKSVVLLSYDKNLCTKTMIYDIVALGRHDPLEKLDYLNVSSKIVNLVSDVPVEYSIVDEELRLADDIFVNVKAIMKDFLSMIIIKQMSDIYGKEDWEKYVIIKPPWTVVTALKCAIKHWIAAISESFQRRSLYILKELLQSFDHLPTDGRKLKEMEHILEKCSELIQTTNTQKYHELGTESFNLITELKKRCFDHITDINTKILHDKIGTASDFQEEQHRAEKTIHCFKHIYNYARDMCGLAANIAGMACSFNFNPINPPLPPAAVKRLQPEITQKVIELTQNLNKLLEQAENSTTKYQTLFTLQQNINSFLPDREELTFDLTALDIYYCVKLKEDILETGLKQLQELSTHYCALVNHT